MSNTPIIIKLFCFLIIIVTFTYPTSANEKKVLEGMLIEFLSGQTEQHHAEFWADDLIYTSSNGTRFGKVQIMSGFNSNSETSTANNSEESSLNTVSYSAADIDIRLHNEMAIVAFKLVAKEDSIITQTYWNTGTLLKRNDKWQVVAWQATKIP